MDIDMCIDSRNHDIVSNIKSKYEIIFAKSEKVTWGSDLNGGIVHIYYSETDHPEASLTHELLHIDTQIKGYNRIRAGISMSSKNRKHLVRITNCLDNELQHHKMYSTFISLGFSPDEFYCDSDSQTPEILDGILSQKYLNFIDLFPDYMTAIAPGGSNPVRMSSIAGKFREYDRSAYKKRFQQIDKILTDWANSSSYEVEETVKRIFKVLRINDVWFCNTDGESDFPKSGFFVDIPFNESQIQ